MSMRDFPFVLTMILIIVLSYASSVIADDVFDDDDAIILDYDDLDHNETMIIVRERIITPLSPLSPSTRIIRVDEFRGKFSDLPSLLETVTGVDVRATGGRGQYAESSIRGGSSLGLRVYLDGVLLNSASGGAVNIGALPLDKIREIRITKSTSTLRQMGAGTGGVIELFTTDDANKNFTSVNLEGGSFGYINAGAVVKRNRHQFNADISSSENNYPFTHDNGTRMPTLNDPDPTWDDTLMRKANNFYRAFDAAYSFNFELRDIHHITQRVSGNIFEQGLFVYHYKDDQSGAAGGASLLYGADYRGDISERLTVGGEANVIYRRRFLNDPDGRMTLGEARREITSNDIAIDALVDARFAMRENFYVAGLVGTRFEQYAQNDAARNVNPQMNRNVYTIGGEAAYNINLRDNLSSNASSASTISIETALRAAYKFETDTTSAGFDYWSASGASYTLSYPITEAAVRANIDRVTLQLSAATSKRSPTFFERFGWSGGFLSNPDLREETRFEVDAGASLNMRTWNAAASIFAGRINDKIKSLPQRNFVRVMNFADTEFYGAEIDVNAKFARVLTAEFGASYLQSTITRAADQSWVGRTEPFVPNYSAFLKTEIDVSRLNIGHGIKYESECFLNIENNTRREAQSELSAWIAYKFFDMLTLRYRVDNYLNSAKFDFLDNPSPRRTHVFSASLNF